MLGPGQLFGWGVHAKADLSVDVYQGREADPAATLARLQAGVASVATAAADEDGEA